MTTVLYLPLDERPCNALFPIQIAAASDLEMLSPPQERLGSKKRPADPEAVSEWLLQHAHLADYLILSIDMLVYGGIVPSRLHHYDEAYCAERLRIIAECKRLNPRLRIFAFNLIMRAPAYSSSEEEPDYYAEFGAELNRSGWLQDKERRAGLTGDEAAELARIAERLPGPVREDFLSRRGTNASVNRMSIEWTRTGTIDFLIIPLDDNAEYGYSSYEQRQLLHLIKRERLLDRVHMYPGADEIGCTLLARVFCEAKRYRPEVFIRHSSTQGPFIIPKYEDRSLGESLKAHLTAAGAFIADHSAEANVVLMVNSPPAGADEMAEASTPYEERDAAYFAENGLREFVQAIRAYCDKGKLVALADVATCNGADEPLMELVSAAGLLPRLSAYAGWNTSGNTLGTVIAHAIVESYYRRGGMTRIAGREQRSEQFYISRLLEDWGYQAVIRKRIVRGELKALGGSYFNVGHIEEQVAALIHRQMKDFLEQYAADLQPERIRITNVRLPWKRMFEIGFELHAAPRPIQ